MQPSDIGETTPIVEELIPGTHLQRRVDVASGREIAPEFIGAAQGVQTALAEAALHSYKAVRYGAGRMCGWAARGTGSTRNGG